MGSVIPALKSRCFEVWNTSAHAATHPHASGPHMHPKPKGSVPAFPNPKPSGVLTRKCTGLLSQALRAARRPGWRRLC